MALARAAPDSHGAVRAARRPRRPGLRVAVIAAVAANGTIGAGGTLPWRLSDDLRRFRALTTGHAVVMGRRTWQSLGRPAARPAEPGRVPRSRVRRTGCRGRGKPRRAFALVRLPLPVFCIGGAELYALALPRADLLYLTEIDRDFAGDVRFPAFDRRRVARGGARAAHRAVPGRLPLRVRHLRTFG